MTDVFGNYVIQKVLQYGTPEQRKLVLHTMQGQIVNLSLGTYGCRVVQKALEVLELEDQIIVAEELRGFVHACVKDQNANHVIQKVIETTAAAVANGAGGDPECVDFIPLSFRGQVLPLAAHCYSCRVLQRIFEHGTESQKRPLLDELLSASQRLMQDQYGNYVVQWVLQQGSPSDRLDVIRKTKGNILQLSRHKFASNVVEEIIRASEGLDRVELIEEILTPDASATTLLPTPVVLMMKDQYANYVLQRFLEVAEGEQFVRLATMIQPQLANMRRYSSGMSKHLSAIERILAERGVSVGVTPMSPAAGNGAAVTAPTPTPAPAASAVVSLAAA
ncbi:unnamed protein product [Tilletia controversa]|nr:unnamed protein product [Tilletia controversa]